MLSIVNITELTELQNWADYIIVGAGSSGSIVAARLAADKKNKVLLIEAGPNNYDNKDIIQAGKYSKLWNHPDGPKPSPSNLNFQTTVQRSRTYTYPRGNGAGGCTNHHSLIDGRGSPAIYDNIANLVNDSVWSYKNVLPYFKKMESYYNGVTNHYHGYNGWLKVRPATVRSPFHSIVQQVCSEVTSAPIRSDMSGHPEENNGVGKMDMQVSPTGLRTEPFSDLVAPLLSQKNIIVLFNSLSSRILFNNKPSLTAIGVHILHKPGVYIDDHAYHPQQKEEIIEIDLYARKEVIISAGAINTPQLLMLSGIGPREHLQSLGIEIIVDAPGVGSYLMDHHELNVVHEMDVDKIVWPAQANKILKKLNKLPKLSIEQLQLKKHLLPFAALDFDFKETNDGAGGIILDWFSGLDTDIEHDLHMDFSENFFYDFDLSSNDLLPNGNIRMDYIASEENVVYPQVWHHVLIEVLRPTSSSGSIRLASPNPRVSPLIDLALYKDEEACERLARGIEIVRSIFNHPKVKFFCKTDVFGSPVEHFPGLKYKTREQLKEYIKNWSSFGHHISGTAKMGIDSDSVVDSRLRVYGVSNLRIIDTSIYPFPYLHGYNTSRGAYLIGELGSDFILNNNLKNL